MQYVLFIVDPGSPDQAVHCDDIREATRAFLRAQKRYGERIMRDVTVKLVPASETTKNDFEASHASPDNGMH